MPIDRVRALKVESTSTGGDHLDEVEYPTPTQPHEDYLDARGIAFQTSISNDENVRLERSSTDNLALMDIINRTDNSSSMATLSELRFSVRLIDKNIKVPAHHSMLVRELLIQDGAQLYIENNAEVFSIGVDGNNNVNIPNINIISPLSTRIGDDIYIDHANSFSLPGSFTSADINTNLYTDFIIPKLTANITVPIPTGTKQGRVISFYIRGGTSAYTVSWTAGAGGYMFAHASGALGVKQSQFDDHVAALADNDVLIVGWRYYSYPDRWLCVALSGPYRL